MCEPITASAALGAGLSAGAAGAAGITAGAAGAAGVSAAAATAATATTAATAGGIFGTGLTWSTLSTIGSIAGTALSAMSADAQGKAAKNAAEYNARMGQIQAQDVINRAAIEQEKQRQKVAQLRGTQRANQGASGLDVDSGSFGTIGEQTVVLGTEDEMMIRNNAARSAWGYRAQAGLDYQTGIAAARAKRLDAAGTLLSGGARAMGAKWWKDLA